MRKARGATRSGMTGGMIGYCTTGAGRIKRNQNLSRRNSDMDAKFKVSDPDKIKMTLELTMTLGSWKKLRGQINSPSHPSWELDRRIREMIELAAYEYQIEHEGG